jgi:hypothetical protein
MAVVTADTSSRADHGLRGPVPARTTGPGTTAGARRRPGRAELCGPGPYWSWPLRLRLRSGWVGIAKMTGFGLVSPLPGIWPRLHLDTAITLPVGVEAYAA